MTETYAIDEFTTGTWSDREEYESDCISWDHALTIHRERPNFQESGKCGDVDFHYVLHCNDGISFEFFVYRATAFSANLELIEVEPFMWIYGTTFDGVRECSGGQNFSGDLREMAKCIVWVHDYCSEKWPRFKEWYAPLPG